MKTFLFFLLGASLVNGELRHIRDLKCFQSLNEELAAGVADTKPWQEYLEKSNKMREKEISILKDESAGAAIQKAPSNGDFKYKADDEGNFYASEQAKKIADIMVSFQTPAGGWTKKLSAEDGERVKGMSWSTQSNSLTNFHYVGTFDNRATTEQIRLLAGVYKATNDKKYLDSFTKGMDYIFSAQYPNGGFPQCYPLEHAYHDLITLNDAAMINILKILHEVSLGENEFTFASPELKERAGKSLAKGLDCLLKMQITINGKKTVWCAQHECISLKPAAARLKEPPSLSGGESAAVLKFLMTIKKPTPEIIKCIEDALVWFKDNKVMNPEKNVETWARFYDLQSGKPIFAGAEDGLLYDNFAEMKKHNHVGYDYYTNQAKDVVTKGEIKWRKMLDK